MKDMEKIYERGKNMKFNINNTEWIIKEINNADMQDKFCLDDKFTHGITVYSENTIYLNKDSKNMLKALKHELTHVWLSEYGHNQDEKEFNNEDICEIVASSNDFINEVVNQYLGIESLYVCDVNRNIDCKKKSCYINGGDCMQTNNIKFAKRKSYEH